MKKIILALGVLAFTLVSCKKEEAPTPEKNNINYDGSESEISLSQIIDYGNTNEDGSITYTNYNLDIYLATGTLTPDSQGWLTGTGNMLYFEFWSGAATLATGTYSISPGSYDENLKISSSDIAINYDGSTEMADSWPDIVSGTVHVNNLGDYKYEITVDATDENGKKVTAYFNGQLDYYKGY